MTNPGRPIKCDPKVGNLRSEIAMNRFDIAKDILTEFGIDATDGEGRTALINAVLENKPDFVHWLVDNGANINHQDRNGYSVLHFTAQEKFVDYQNIFWKKVLTQILKTFMEIHSYGQQYLMKKLRQIILVW